MLKLKAKLLDIEPAIPMVMLNVEDAQELGVRASDRVKILVKGKWLTTILDTSKRLVRQGELGVDRELVACGVKIDSLIDVAPTTRPKSLDYIKKKMAGEELKKEEIFTIIDDIYNNNISDIELGAFVSAVYTKGYTMKETIWVTERMIQDGEQLKWPKKKLIVSEHSIGGVPGNRTTPIMVPILAAVGLAIPKTSTRAITSPSGTADTMEIFCPVSFNAREIKQIVNKTNGCIVWGGAVDLAPVDDDIIKAEYPLSLDPEGQVLASIMSKIKATGAKYLLLEIPFGPGSKVEKLDQAERLAKKFKFLGSKLGMIIECAITRGDQPVGNGIGPVLEAIDIMSVLKGTGHPADLRFKSIELSGMLLKLTKKGDEYTAEQMLNSGKALAKFKEIVEAQGGSLDKKLESLLGKEIFSVRAKKSGSILRMRNDEISRIARTTGAPKDRGAGIYLHAKVGQIVRRGEKLFDIYAEKKYKLKETLELLKSLEPITIGSPEELLVEKV